jgi:hypothetical protein
MSEPHVIRLRGPWQFEPVARFDRGEGDSPILLGDHPTDGARRKIGTVPVGFETSSSDLPAGGKTEIPGDWTAALGSGFFGRVRYTRPFNCPTNLDALERVWLVCEAVSGVGEFALNGKPILTMTGTDRPGSCDITSHLSLHNVLVVEVTAQPGDRVGGITGEVRLEIRRG